MKIKSLEIANSYVNEVRKYGNKTQFDVGYIRGWKFGLGDRHQQPKSNHPDYQKGYDDGVEAAKVHLKKMYA